jgi:hypothetical protein
VQIEIAPRLPASPRSAGALRSAAPRLTRTPRPVDSSVAATQKRRSYVDDVRAVLKKAESLQKAAVANAVKQ